ncbi:MAG TPA: prepilin-type N-terminal cleavage/methylation domain-containing protein [Stellaceae bacterium]|nr:prepilin-type N-terminal cleavage/methylation domain-containing protein [Stellaceae bacterium]
MRRDRRIGGFLLLELLVALALTAIVALLLLNGLRVASLGLDRLSYRSDQLEARRGLEELLRRALGSVPALPLTVDGPPFTGKAHSVSFLSLFEDSGPGLYRVGVSLQNAGGEERLVFSRQPVGAGPVVRPEPVVLARRVRGFTLAYFGAVDPNEEPAWHDEWQTVGVPPRLVRAGVDLGDELVRPPIVVRVWGVGG